MILIQTLLLLLIDITASAAGWDSVWQIPANSKTNVTRKSDTVKGTFVRANEEAIVLRGASGEVSIPRGEVKRVKVADSSRRMRNGLLGVAIGAAAGIGIGFGVCPGCANEGHGGKYIGPGVAIGAAAGAAAGFLPTAYRTVYKATK